MPLRRQAVGDGDGGWSGGRASANRRDAPRPRLRSPRHWRSGRSGAGKERRDPLAEGLDVVAAHALVADAAGDLAKARFQRRAALGRVEDALLGLARPDQVDQRPRRGDHLGHGVAAGGADQVVGVLPLGEEREAEALARLRAAAGRGRRRGRRRGCRPCRRRSRGSARRPSATGSGAGARSARCRAARRCGRSRRETMRITST